MIARKKPTSKREKLKNGMENEANFLMQKANSFEMTFYVFRLVSVI